MSTNEVDASGTTDREETGTSSEDKAEKKTSSTNPEQHDTEHTDQGPSETDMIIRDGFPALHTPGSKTFQPNLKDEEPIPRHTFWFHENAIQFHPNHLESLRHDCETVFTARDKPDGAAYSAGQTFFLPANKSPRCALEALTIMIFQKHTEHLPPGTFNPNISGANWWTLVMDNDDDDGINEKGGGTTETSKDHEESTEGNDDDEVGLHFDADYELEEQTTNILLHPRVATVTYLSDYGAPTAIFNLKSPSMDDVERKALEKPIDKAWLSHPQVGKHTAFDGRLLHGAPGLYFPSRRNNTTTVTTDVEPPVKRQKVDTANRKRYTLLVNVWLNHWVMDAALLDEEVCAQMKTPWEDPNSILKQGDSYTPPFSWNAAADLSKPSQISSKVKLEPSSVDPAGEDDITLCNHHVTVRYNPLMAECHGASNQSSTVELELARDAIQLEVGDALEDDGGEQGKS